MSRDTISLHSAGNCVLFVLMLWKHISRASKVVVLIHDTVSTAHVYIVRHDMKNLEHEFWNMVRNGRGLFQSTGPEFI